MLPAPFAFIYFNIVQSDEVGGLTIDSQTVPGLS